MNDDIPNIPITIPHTYNKDEIFNLTTQTLQSETLSTYGIVSMK